MEMHATDTTPPREDLDLLGADTDADAGRIFSRRLHAWHWVLFALIAAVAFGIRFYRVGDVPAGLYCDEAGLGYNAFALANYGIDENGVRWPLFSWSFVSYKNPVFIYAAMFPIKVFGLSEMSLRLTSVLFGWVTVLALFWMLTELWGATSALFGSFLLAVTPWHIHMSRIAFELISFPCLFMIGMVFLVRAIRRGGFNWAVAMFFFGLTPYSYAIANLFVPLFLGGVFVLFFKEILKHKISFFAGIVVILLTVAPFVHFNLTKPRTDQYFKRNSWVTQAKPLKEKADIFLRNYQGYYGADFLFRKGDPLIRHSVSGHGELYWSFLPLIIGGLGLISWTPSRFRLMMLWWLLTFPIGAALMHEEMSATRSIIGSPLPAILGAFTCVTVLSWIMRIRWRWLAILIALSLTGFLLICIVRDVRAYQTRYFDSYYKQSARGIYGFQYGYRELYEYMESVKDDYPQRFLTATDVNMPYIFALFYTRKDPHDWVNGRRTGYQEFKPDEFRRYEVDKPTLFAVRPNEVNYFEEYDVKREIIGPDGVTEFVIIDLKKRKQFLTDWSALGLFGTPREEFFSQSELDFSTDSDRNYDGLHGPIQWQRMDNQFINVDLNGFFARKDPQAQNNPEECCGKACTYIQISQTQHARIEVFGSPDPFEITINGQVVLEKTVLQSTRVDTRDCVLVEGWNQVFVRSCEGVGDWYFTLRLIDLEGRSIELEHQQSYPPADFDLNRIRESSGKITQPDAGDAGGDARKLMTEHRICTGDDVDTYCWKTEDIEANVTAKITFSGAFSGTGLSAELWVNGRINIPIEYKHVPTQSTWKGDGAQLVFIPEDDSPSVPGSFLLEIEPGRLPVKGPLELCMVVINGAPESCFHLFPSSFSQ